jgi:hypothetical protein
MHYSDYECFRFRFDCGVAFVSIDRPPINLLDEVLKASSTEVLAGRAFLARVSHVLCAGGLSTPSSQRSVSRFLSAAPDDRGGCVCHVRPPTLSSL